MYLYRHYEAELGRWPSRDPIIEKGGVNLYAVVGNFTLNQIDLWGLKYTVTKKDIGEPGFDVVKSWNFKGWLKEVNLNVAKDAKEECEKACKTWGMVADPEKTSKTELIVVGKKKGKPYTTVFGVSHEQAFGFPTASQYQITVQNGIAQDYTHQTYEAVKWKCNCCRTDKTNPLVALFLDYNIWQYDEPNIEVTVPIREVLYDLKYDTQLSVFDPSQIRQETLDLIEDAIVPLD